MDEVGPWERADPTSDSRVSRSVALCHAGQGSCWGLVLPENSGSVGTGGSSPGCHHAAARGGGSVQRVLISEQDPRSLPPTQSVTHCKD